MALNPFSVQIDGVTVDDANPCPATIAAVGSPGADVVINPRELIVNGESVSDSNPFPIQVV